MYEAYYGLREKPFSILPDPDLIYWGRAHRMAFSMLEFGVLNNAQFTVITGEVGSGKTTLVRHLLRKVDPKHINVGSDLEHPARSRRAAAVDHDVVGFAVRGLDPIAAQDFPGLSLQPARARTPHRPDRRRSAKSGREPLSKDCECCRTSTSTNFNFCNPFSLASRSSRKHFCGRNSCNLRSVCLLTFT